MSQNDTQRITVIRTEVQTENERKHRLPDIRVILLAAGVLLLLMMILFLILLRQIQKAPPKGSFVYSEEPAAVFDLSGVRHAAAFGDCLVTVSEAGCSLMDRKGNLLSRAEHTYLSPVVYPEKRLVMVCDMGGQRLTVLDRRGGTVLDLQTKGDILDADLNGKALCYADLQPGYKTVLTVCDEQQNVIYQWYSASRYMNRCAVSSDAKQLCAVALDGSDARFQSKAVLFETDLEEPVCEILLGDQLILDLSFVDDDTMCAIGEQSVLFFSVSGEIQNEFSYQNAYLQHHSTEGNGFLALVLNKYQSGNANTLVTLDEQGSLLSERYLGEEILNVSTVGSFLAVQTPEMLYLYDQELNLCTSQPASASVVFDDGSIILIEDDVGIRYLPE